jgi:hypothetical protein
MADAASLISMVAALEDPAERDSVHGTSSAGPAAPRRGGPQQQQNGQPAASSGPEAGPAADGAPNAAADRVILTPTKLRVDSRVVVVHTSAQWLTNLFFVLFVLWKVGSPARPGRPRIVCPAPRESAGPRPPRPP